ncbi:MAG: cyclic nucleotide-binding domain-containing protein [Chthoniobacterales bacterium]
MTSALFNPMPAGDFFAFCTSLKPVELRAIGELSEVRHFEAEQEICRPGEAPDAFYIINRGVVEVLPQSSQGEIAKGYLLRGDIFGDLEALGNLPHSQTVRASEPVSLQVFARKDFSELLRRVPSFFLYLSHHLANRLLQARNLALSQSHSLELRGSLANFDLVTIYQTIVNSLQTGELSVLNEEGETVSAFFFEAGRPRRGHLHHLTGEEAFWQLFLCDGMSGNFSFSSAERPASGQAEAGEFSRTPGDMLISALQMRDEWEAMKQNLPPANAELRRKKLNLEWPAFATELRPLAEHIWQVAYSSPITLAELFNRCSFCELKIHRVVQELVASAHFDLCSPETLAETA